MSQQGALFGGIFGVDEELGECRMGQICGFVRKGHFGVRGQLELHGFRAQVLEAQPAQLDVPPTTDLTPYQGGDLKDDSHMIGDYISVSSHSASRAMSIDRKNPEFMKGVPYTLYPIYGVRGASLYYIGSSSNTVKLAVRTSSHW